MSYLTTVNDMNNLRVVDCQNINIYMMLIISSLVFVLMINLIYFVCFRIKSKTVMEVKVDTIDKNLTNLLKIFRELKKID